MLKNGTASGSGGPGRGQPEKDNTKDVEPTEQDPDGDEDQPMETGDEDQQQQQEEQSGASSSGTVAVPTGPPHPNAQGWYGVENPTPACRFSYQFPEYHHPSNKSSHDLRHTYQWDVLLAEPDFVAAPVTAFKHAPMSCSWDHVVVGMKVEVENKDYDTDIYAGLFSTCYWVASVLRIAGYHALFRYEGFGQDGSKDFWMNVCSDKLHHIGWCATQGKPLIPPKTIQSKYTDWKDFLVKRLTGARTVPTNFYNKIYETVSSAFKKGMKLEVVDKMRICQVRVATIQEITGRRLYLQYDDVDHDDKGFWCHEESPLIHPVGWAKRVDHQIAAPKDYFTRCERNITLETDCTPDMFPDYRQAPGNFQVGMKIEAVDPLNLASICVATVTKVLRFGYIMIRIDGYETDESGSDCFCYHASSPLIFPPGFSEKKNIKLKPPAGKWETNFTWYDYLKSTNSQAAPQGLFIPKDNVKHSFKVGMKMEAADQMDPRLICVSTISRVVGRLLKVHFDGWEEDYDQWMDCENVDIYPVGWAALVGHKLEGPRQSAPVKKEKRKPAPKKGKKRASNGSTAASSAGGSTASPSGSGGSGAAAASAGSTSSATSGGPASAGASVAAVTNLTPTGASRKARKSATPSPNQPQLATPTGSGTSSLTPSSARGTPPPPVLEAQTGPPIAAAASPAVGSSSTAAAFSNNSSATTTLSSPAASSASNTAASASSGVAKGSTGGATAPPVAHVAPMLHPKSIPRLVDSTGEASLSRGRDSSLDPASWTSDEMAQFLEINECANLVETFTNEGVSGEKFLRLEKADIMKLVNNKIGPCLKVENLLSLLKARMSPAHARLLSASRKTNP